MFFLKICSDFNRTYVIKHVTDYHHTGHIIKLCHTKFKCSSPLVRTIKHKTAVTNSSLVLKRQKSCGYVSILYTDGAHFHFNGYPNKKTMHNLATGNPDEIKQTQLQPPKFIIKCVSAHCCWTNFSLKHSKCCHIHMLKSKCACFSKIKLSISRKCFFQQDCMQYI